MAKKVPKKNGRPVKFETPAQLAELVLTYIDNCTEKHQMPNKAGLCIWLNIHKDTYNDYKKKDGFSAAIKGAEMWIENAWVQRLAGANATGAIFYLKAAMGYRDLQELDVTTKGQALQRTNVSTMTPEQLDEYLRTAFIRGPAQ